ncbi:MAG: M28 family peptidase [Taibaiella sp.]|nr:M28 family peptidase [Taibaiella sp.]
MLLRKILLLPAVVLAPLGVWSQTAITSTDTLAAKIMMGNYDPAAYMAGTVIDHPDAISSGIRNVVSADSLHAYLDKLRSFKTRNTGSDTLSATRGIGAARRWIHGKFEEISALNDNRLKPSYLQFEQAICGISLHRNVFAVLPGTDTADKAITIIEAHMDSRCAGLCDTACVAEGMEDNGSGTALVIELARVMSKYSYKRTVVFMTTTSEEQGLNGAQAFATYAALHNIKIRGVLNSDVIGGIICGHTSSPPSCPGFKQIDSTQVRLFSFGGFNSFHKGLSRFIKLEYKEMQLPFVSVPMMVSIMTPEDRTGRGGDHIPFRTGGYPAMRFTSANESGDADVSSSTYMDRQHTSSDSIGVDNDLDGTLDEYYVDFNYLARNTVINGNAAAMMCMGPRTPDFTLTATPGNLLVNLTAETGYPQYRVGVRTTTNDWDSVYTFSGGSTTFTVPVTGTGNHIVSIASVDDKGVESLFSKELQVAVVSGFDLLPSVPKQVELLQNKPNPADEATMISVLVNDHLAYKEAYVTIKDLNGREVQRMNITLNNGVNEIMYDHGYNVSGTYTYTLVIDGKVIESKRMIFAN